MSDIRPLTLADRSLVSEYLRTYSPEISEQTFTNLFIWQPSRPILFAEIDKSLVFLVNAAQAKGKYILFGPPAGKILIPEVFSFLDEDIIGAVRIPDTAAENLPVADFVVTPDRDNADYVYRVMDLAELGGRHYAKKRNHIKQCLSNHACEYVPITAELIAECETMQENWCNTRDCGRNPGLCNEANAIAEELSPGTAVWHFEKAMADIPGLGQLINHWFSKYGLSDFDYVNREQDLGIPGMRQAKESYHPHHMVPKNCISRSVDQPITAKSIKADGCAAHEH
jgi:hypothetical protein